ncbi:hypothetical protein PHISP_06883 [Aspergillus sp. HF37]|nr:hypothetical protein PHISP_06883 [Aspergillus sp. HF37]
MRQAGAISEFVLCFDGTGFKFRGDEADSNVLKIFRKMLDRNTSQIHYYQPGIGTNTNSIWLSPDTRASSVKRWYAKTKDAAVGSTFEEHVMAGYRYLMRFYSPRDRIYIFGFSRGAYVARILAEMLDHVGLLEPGNEGKVRYVWSTFNNWARLFNSKDAGQKEKDETYRYMKALRETFCLPILQIRFLGLFDTVNSVPQFEANRNKFMFPYTAKTSARVIRHAVSIDEHRAKFREDLISNANPTAGSARKRPNDHKARRVHPRDRQDGHLDGDYDRRPTTNEGPRQGASAEEALYRPVPRSHRPDQRTQPESQDGTLPGAYTPEECEVTAQDIEEVWFPGCHEDIGGGLKPREDEGWALSHVPLVWMVHEAQRAGLQFDPDKLKQFHCFGDSIDSGVQHDPGHRTADLEGKENEGVSCERSDFEYAFWRASTNGQLHDNLRYGHDAPWPTVLSWRMVEYLPFRRLSLQEDGSWKPIRWPLPRGERRDIPRDATIHGSVIRRMEVNSKYRPKNLIRRGKGKEKEKGGDETEQWEVRAHHGCPVRETYRRK